MSKIFKIPSYGTLLACCPQCHTYPDLVAWYIKGVANRRNYAIVCPNCHYRLKEPYKFNKPEKAIRFWNETIKNKGGE